MNSSAKKPLIVVLLLALVGGTMLLAEHKEPVADKATQPQAESARTKEQAMSALMALPELQAWSTRIEEASKGAARGALIEYDPEPKVIAGKRYWQLSFVENSSDAAHRWESFLVAETGAEILVDDPESGNALTLAQWRKDKRPLERIAAQ